MNALVEIFKNIEKKYLYIGGGFLAVMVFAAIFGSCNKKPGGQVAKDYESIKTILVEAATKYYDDNKIFLPNIGEKAQVTDETLHQEGYIEELSSYAPKDVKCSGKVVLTRIDRDENNLVAFLDCGEAFTELALWETVLEDNPIVTEGNGLYQIGDLKVFRGEPKNNYLRLHDHLYRIVSLDQDNNITIIYEARVDQRRDSLFDRKFYWDNRLNSEKMEKIGINTFELSRLKEEFLTIINEEELLPKDIRPNLLKRQLCIGKVKSEETKMDNSLECALLSQEEFYLGTLTASEAARVSLDSNCQSFNSVSCINYNYLFNIPDVYWTITATEENTYQAFVMDMNGLSLYNNSYQNKFRPTFKLSNTTVKIAGDGTKQSPYEPIKKAKK